MATAPINPDAVSWTTSRQPTVPEVLCTFQQPISLHGSVTTTVLAAIEERSGSIEAPTRGLVEPVIFVSAPSRQDRRAWLETVRTRIDAVLAEADPEEWAPTSDAQESLLAILSEAISQLPPGGDSPVPVVTSHGDGDLACTWYGQSRELVLSVRHDGRRQLHKLSVEREKGAMDRKSVVEPGPEDLVRSIAWFTAYDKGQRVLHSDTPNGDTAAGGRWKVVALVEKRTADCT